MTSVARDEPLLRRDAMRRLLKRYDWIDLGIIIVATVLAITVLSFLITVCEMGLLSAIGALLAGWLALISILEIATRLQRRPEHPTKTRDAKRRKAQP